MFYVFCVKDVFFRVFFVRGLHLRGRVGSVRRFCRGIKFFVERFFNALCVAAFKGDESGAKDLKRRVA